MTSLYRGRGKVVVKPGFREAKSVSKPWIVHSEGRLGTTNLIYRNRSFIAGGITKEVRRRDVSGGRKPREMGSAGLAAD